jgi:hypothetical protein
MSSSSCFLMIAAILKQLILLLGKVIIKNFQKSTDADRTFLNQHSLPMHIPKDSQKNIRIF